jgi:nucleoporin p58/p45
MKPSVGLGGTAFAGFGGTTIGTGSIPVTTAGQLQAGIDGNKAAAGSGGGLKETNIPKELMDDIDNFKRFVKEEKSVSSDIAHVSPKAHQKLKTEIKALNTIVKELASGVSKQKIQVEKLKKESALEMQNVEIAQVYILKFGRV